MHDPLDLKSDYINLLLDVAAQRTRERGDIAYESTLGISLRDIRLLRLIGTQPGVAMGELAGQSGIEKTLASKLIGSLVQRGFIERHIGQKDARQIQLSLTDAGIDLVQRAEPLGRQLESGLKRWLTRAELQALCSALNKIIDAEAASRDEFEAWIEQLSTVHAGG